MKNKILKSIIILLILFNYNKVYSLNLESLNNFLNNTNIDNSPIKNHNISIKRFSNLLDYEFNNLIKNTIYILVEQENLHQDFYIIFPGKNLNIQYPQTIILKSEQKNSKLKIKFNLEERINFNNMIFSVFKCSVEDNDVKKENKRIIKASTGTEFTEIKINNKDSIIKFNKIRDNVFFMIGLTEDFIAENKVLGDFVYSENIETVEQNQNYVNIQQGVIVFEMDELEKLSEPPTEIKKNELNDTEIQNKVETEIEEKNILLEQDTVPQVRINTDTEPEPEEKSDSVVSLLEPQVPIVEPVLSVEKDIVEENDVEESLLTEETETEDRQTEISQTVSEDVSETEKTEETETEDRQTEISQTVSEDVSETEKTEETEEEDRQTEISQTVSEDVSETEKTEETEEVAKSVETETVQEPEVIEQEKVEFEITQGEFSFPPAQTNVFVEEQIGEITESGVEVVESNDKETFEEPEPEEITETQPQQSLSESPEKVEIQPETEEVAKSVETETVQEPEPEPVVVEQENVEFEITQGEFSFPPVQTNVFVEEQIGEITESGVEVVEPDKKETAEETSFEETEAEDQEAEISQTVSEDVSETEKSEETETEEITETQPQTEEVAKSVETETVQEPEPEPVVVEQENVEFEITQGEFSFPPVQTNVFVEEQIGEITESGVEVVESEKKTPPEISETEETVTGEENTTETAGVTEVGEQETEIEETVTGEENTTETADVTEVGEQETEIEETVTGEENTTETSDVTEVEEQETEMVIEPVYIELNLPENNSIINDSQPLFKWSTVSNAEIYQFYLSKSPFSENNIIVLEDIYSTEYQFSINNTTEELLTNNQYTWFVVAFDSNDNILTINDNSSLSYFTYIAPSVAQANEETVEESSDDTITVEVSNLRINEQSIEVYEQETSLNKDDLIDNNLIIDFTVTDAQNINKIEISFDNGSSYEELSFEKEGTQNIEYMYRPESDMTIEPKLKITLSNEKIIEDDFFNSLKIDYVNKTNEELIEEMLDKFCNAIETNDVNGVMECISENFTGNSSGYTDYDEMNDSIKDYFNKTINSYCIISNTSININSATRATVTFELKREIYYSKIGLTKNISIASELDLINTEGTWKILSDRSDLIFMKYFPPIPAPPQ